MSKHKNKHKHRKGLAMTGKGIEPGSKMLFEQDAKKATQNKPKSTFEDKLRIIGHIDPEVRAAAGRIAEADKADITAIARKMHAYPLYGAEVSKILGREINKKAGISTDAAYSTLISTDTARLTSAVMMKETDYRKARADGAMIERKKHTFLHDAILLQDADPEKMLRRYGIDPKKLKGIDFYVKLFHRFALRVKAAEKYVLDKAALAHIVEAANYGPGSRDWAAYWDSTMMMARLPHQHVFVEFDIDDFNACKQANGTYQPTGNKLVGGRGGYLMERLTPDDPTRWTAQFCIYSDNRDDFVDFGGVGFMLGTENEELPVVGEDGVSDGHEYHDMGLLPRRAALDKEDSVIKYMHDFSWGTYRGTDQDGNPIPYVTERMRRSLRLMLPAITAALELVPGKEDSDQSHSRHVAESVRDARGDVRHLLAFLALMNAVPVQNIVREPQGVRTVGTRVVRWQPHNQVNFINLRTTTVVKQLKRAGKEYAKKRNHGVRMHLRSIWFPETPVCSVVEHRSLNTYEPAPDFGSKYVRCRKCGLVRRWIPEHRRGDINLGTVGQHPHGVTSHG